MNVKVLYKTDHGVIGAVSRRLQVDMACEMVKEKKIHLYPPRCADGYFAPTSGGVEVRLPVELKMDLFEESTLSPVKMVTVDEVEKNNVMEGPSLIAVRCRDDNLWSLAKRYKTTADLIRCANKNTVEIGEVLLIPRPR